jgi:hypothetical protein
MIARNAKHWHPATDLDRHSVAPGARVRSSRPPTRLRTRTHERRSPLSGLLTSDKPMFARRLLRHHSRPRWTVRTSAPATAFNAAAPNARATLTLTLAALGLIDVIDSLGVLWSSLVTTLLLALLALALFVAAQHSHDRRFDWLLSASVSTGLAIADFYNLIKTAPTASAAVLVTFMAILRLVVRDS